jgi:hypothetical protein
MLGRYDSWRLACFLAKQQPKEPTIYAELEARGISQDGIGEMLALAAWAVEVMNPPGDRITRTIADASDLEAALEIAQHRKLIDDRDLAARRAMLAAYF